MSVKKANPSKALATIENIKGRVGVPILLYVLGVPGFVCILLWLFFFKGS